MASLNGGEALVSAFAAGWPFAGSAAWLDIANRPARARTGNFRFMIEISRIYGGFRAASILDQAPPAYLISRVTDPSSRQDVRSAFLGFLGGGGMSDESASPDAV